LNGIGTPIDERNVRREFYAFLKRKHSLLPKRLRRIDPKHAARRHVGGHMVTSLRPAVTAASDLWPSMEATVTDGATN
jgi:hypothetical protein